MAAILIHLSDELLLNNTMCLNVAAVRNIALACERLRCIAQEALVRAAALCPRHVWQFVDLLQQRPQLERLLSSSCLGRHEFEG